MPGSLSVRYIKGRFCFLYFLIDVKGLLGTSCIFRNSTGSLKAVSPWDVLWAVKFWACIRRLLKNAWYQRSQITGALTFLFAMTDIFSNNVTCSGTSMKATVYVWMFFERALALPNMFISTIHWYLFIHFVSLGSPAEGGEGIAADCPSTPFSATAGDNITFEKPS